jgi:hypothetical protein
MKKQEKTRKESCHSQNDVSGRNQAGILFGITEKMTNTHSFIFDGLARYLSRSYDMQKNIKCGHMPRYIRGCQAARKNKKCRNGDSDSEE